MILAIQDEVNVVRMMLIVITIIISVPFILIGLTKYHRRFNLITDFALNIAHIPLSA